MNHTSVYKTMMDTKPSTKETKKKCPLKDFSTSVYNEKSIPMIALWCPAFSNHG